MTSSDRRHAPLLPLVVAAVVSLVATPGRATEPTSTATGSESQLLAALAGEYRLTSTFWPEPGGEPMVSELPARRELILGGRALRLEVGPDPRGFVGAGLSGYDRAGERFWYAWTDSSTSGVAILYGRLDAAGSGSFEGHTPTPGGPVPLRVQIRRDGAAEIHDYFSPAPDGGELRWLELRYERR